MTDALPNQTVYVNNLPEKVKKEGGSGPGWGLQAFAAGFLAVLQPLKLFAGGPAAQAPGPESWLSRVDSPRCLQTCASPCTPCSPSSARSWTWSA